MRAPCTVSDVAEVAVGASCAHTQPPPPAPFVYSHVLCVGGWEWHTWFLPRLTLKLFVGGVPRVQGCSTPFTCRGPQLPCNAGRIDTLQHMTFGSQPRWSLEDAQGRGEPVCVCAHRRASPGGPNPNLASTRTLISESKLGLSRHPTNRKLGCIQSRWRAWGDHPLNEDNNRNGNADEGSTRRRWLSTYRRASG